MINNNGKDQLYFLDVSKTIKAVSLDLISYFSEEQFGGTILEQNFYHESSHMIDKVLEHNALYRTDAIYSEEKWWSFNPKEFIDLNPEYGGYYVSYEMMPMEYYQELFTTYFANDYGKSFSTEDRATILEAAMMGTSQIFSPNISEPLHDKLEYYCQSIRDCFDTTGWPTYTTWENTLRKAKVRAYE